MRNRKNGRHNHNSYRYNDRYNDYKGNNNYEDNNYGGSYRESYGGRGDHQEDDYSNERGGWQSDRSGHERGGYGRPRNYGFDNYRGRDSQRGGERPKRRSTTIPGVKRGGPVSARRRSRNAR